MIKQEGFVARWEPPSGGKVIIWYGTWDEVTKAAKDLMDRLGARKVSIEVMEHPPK